MRQRKGRSKRRPPPANMPPNHDAVLTSALRSVPVPSRWTRGGAGSGSEHLLASLIPLSNPDRGPDSLSHLTILDCHGVTLRMSRCYEVAHVHS